MVLRSNFAKHVDTENTPPSMAKGSAKSLASRLRTSLHDASRRRRARTTGGTRAPKYVVEQAKKRRSETKSPTSSIRFNVPSIPRTPPPVADVEMKDIEPSSAPMRSIPVLLPRELGRPGPCEVSKEAIRAVDPELADTDPEYIRERLEDFGPAMLQVLGSVTANPVKDSLPKELAIVVHDFSSALPTHMMAIYSPESAGGAKKRKVTLFPAHSLILASHCAKLPPFSSSHALPNEESSPQEITIPIAPLCLPSPETYPYLSSYLYIKRTDLLLESLLPDDLPRELAKEGAQLLPFAAKLAGKFTAQLLLQHTMIVHGLWRNVCALGVFDDNLWNTVDLAWEVLLTAIAIGTGNPQAMVGNLPAELQAES